MSTDTTANEGHGTTPRAGRGEGSWGDPDRAEQALALSARGTPRNVVLFIGDGMGEDELTIARNYLKGADGRLILDSFLFTGSVTNYSVTAGDPTRHNYVTDSAAAATAWATGAKTYNGAIGVDAFGMPVPTLVELARDRGMATGIVTTEEVCDPTPAAMGAHVAHRSGRGPDTMQRCPEQATENGGPGSIAEQLVRTRPDVLLGGGAQYFRQTVRAGEFAGRTVLDQAAAAGYRVITTATELAAADAGTPLLGLFGEEALARYWVGPPARVDRGPAAVCRVNPDLPADQPSLARMTAKALEILDERAEGRGFLLQVEAGLIDTAGHDGDACGMISEVAAFDAAVTVGLRWAEEHGDTLVLVTADHGHSAQILPVDVESPGATTMLLAHDGEPMLINYATNLPGEILVHTGAQVRIAAHGPSAASVLGLGDHTDLFHLITRTWKEADNRVAD
ncbi:alkaline phosphatase [Streptomyces abyssomicinicus]|uniref:alkaline phosphatase n=1 Tax=Streptomyces abyssomicinicus TaxID=574929 RepID=UPI0012502A88|nr:alkaline phosphatase [Streptomyces abyssomicinicus]